MLFSSSFAAHDDGTNFEVLWQSCLFKILPTLDYTRRMRFMSLSHLSFSQNSFAPLASLRFVCVFMRCVTFRLRIANRVGEDSCCRGGIVHIRCGCSRARLVRPRVPRRFGGFVQVLQTVQVAVLGRILTRIFVILIILTLNKIFEYVEMTILAAQVAVSESQGAFASSRKYLRHSR